MDAAVPRFGGLSPRLRGSLFVCYRHTPVIGPIPAPAGEPCVFIPNNIDDGAYPRACGGAPNAPRTARDDTGLSPRLRGSPWCPTRPFSPSGPIPAPAGEPSWPAPWIRRRRAYPRACGGAICAISGRYFERGLSPRLRGSRVTLAAAARTPGPIPAPAGEPGQAIVDRARRRAYPRACGGAPPPTPPWKGEGGLSPRLRGSLYHATV